VSGFEQIPIIPHESIGGVDCCGCLWVRMSSEDQAEIVCNECDAVIRTVPVSEVERVLLELVPEADAICSARCSHCGALNTFPGFSTVDAFVCSDCGEGVAVEHPVQ
jgi:hypothetical protein